ncbi:hemin ABC transporter substrate-binding protein [Mesorhizobium sp. B1-1-5]|uniref:heme/hemin ABC transporter substrate-binding protein n=1 Tax=Mesorhizobium sp. B1-1-5 TaxID=2589979 RepID=UPI001129C2E1|nr:hemin ABC transporter substrate-binding protein [Mesorhizobium sp. B1-1-5]TPO05720.1 hemin ABC transporter substrate-binding protein [Mesorhizobium sp. B1-1-5]
MRFALSFRAALAPMLGVLLAVAMQPATADEGTTVFADNSRIASIGGSITEIVYVLGEEGRLVARDSTSNYPEAAAKLPDVGYMRALSPEGVLSVNPTGILALQGSGPKEAVDVLKKSSVAFIEVPDRYDHEGTLEKIRVVGKALGVEAKAEKLVAETDAKLASAEKQTAAIKDRKRVLFVLSTQGGKILAAGSDTAADGIIRLAGAVNAVQGFSGYKSMTDEAIVSARPDVILTMTGGGPTISEAELFANPAVASTPAGVDRKMISMSGGYLLGFGPRTADAIRDLAVSLYGNQVQD